MMFPWLNSIFLTIGCGLFVLTGAHQSHGSLNWAAQYCAAVEGCTRTEWAVVGTALLLAACVMSIRRDADSI
jgi:hypothetical protein